MGRRLTVRPPLGAASVLCLLLAASVGAGGCKTGATSDAEPSGDGALWLGDFESAEELESDWDGRRSRARLSTRSVHGERAAEVVFEGQSRGASSFALSLSRLGPEAEDWSRRERLVFSAHNHESTRERLILQITAGDGSRYKEGLFIGPNATERFDVRIDMLGDYIDVSRLQEISFYRWRPERDATFTLDAIRLEGARDLPSASPATSTAELDKHWRVGWSSSLIKTMREPEKLRARLEGPARMSLARRERESVQIVLVGKRYEGVDVSMRVGPLVHAESDARIGPDAIEIRRVAYVETSRPDYPVTHVGAWPDPLPLGSMTSVPEAGVGALWLTVRADETLPAGLYEGPIELTGSDGERQELSLEVRVWDFALPNEPSLKTAFDLYRPRLLRSYEAFVPGGQTWKERAGELVELYHQDLLTHRINPVVGAEPLEPDGVSELQTLVASGLSSFGVGTRGGTGGNSEWPREIDALNSVASDYAEAARVLERHGLARGAYVYAYDEPEPGLAHTADVMRALSEHAPGLETMLAMFDSPDPERYATWLENVDILAVRLAAFVPEHAQRFRDDGKSVWLYVSSPVHPYPGLVIDEPAMSPRLLPWIARTYEIDGLLYWCVNYWKRGDPWSEPANYVSEQNGNGSLYYPAPEGPVPSIRLAMLRDGIDDFDYFAVLDRLLLEARTTDSGVSSDAIRSAAEIARVPEAIVASTRSQTRNPEELLAHRNSLARAIEELSERLR